MIGKRFDLIAKDDIDALVRDGVPESRTLDYKRELPGNSGDDRKEFVADVSAFANAGGGDLIFGVDELRDAANKPTGVPASAPGLPSVNADAEKLRLEQLMMNGIKPRMSGIQLRSIDGFAEGPVFVLRIPASWAGPHVVDLDNRWRFYSRNSAGKYPMDVSELRTAFALSETLAERVRGFRDERIGKILAEETPIPMDREAKVVLHVVPLTAFDPEYVLDISSIEARAATIISPHFGSHRSYYNFDGIITYQTDTTDSRYSYYSLLFRSGAVEVVDAWLLSETQHGKNIPHEAFELDTVNVLRRVLTFMQQIDIRLPATVMVSLLGVRGYESTLAERPLTPGLGQPVDRDNLIIPEVIIQEHGVEPGSVLRPIFDAVVQAAGFPRSPHYDASGNWHQPC